MALVDYPGRGPGDERHEAECSLASRLALARRQLVPLQWPTRRSPQPLQTHSRSAHLEQRQPVWPVREFPATQRETRGSPALCVSGKFQGNQRVFGAPFWQLSSFPESESWSGSRLGQNLRQNRGNRQIYRVFSRYTRDFSGMPAKHRSILTVRLILGPNQPQTRLRARKNGWFPWKVERKREGAVEKHGKETRQGARGNIRTA